MLLAGMSGIKVTMHLHCKEGFAYDGECLGPGLFFSASEGPEAYTGRTWIDYCVDSSSSTIGTGEAIAALTIDCVWKMMSERKVP